MEKKQNFAGFSEGNSREKSQNSQKNRPISRDFSGKKIQFSNDFQGQIVRKIGQFRRKSRENVAKKQSVKNSRFR